MGVFDAIGGRPQGAPERGFDVGLKFGAIRQANSASAKLQGAMDAFQKGIAQRQENQINEGKAKTAKILGILQEGLGLPEGDPRRAVADNLAAHILSNPALMGSLGIKASNTLSPTDKRLDKANWLEFQGATKSNDSLIPAENALNQLDSVFNEALPQLSQDGTEAIGTGLTKGISGMFGGNEKLRAYKQLSASMSSILSKGLFQEKGVLTDKDREVAMNSLPNEFDSAVTYKTKTEALKSIIQTAKKNYQMKREAFLTGQNFQPMDSGINYSSPGSSSSGNLAVGGMFNGQKIKSIEEVK